MISSRSPPPSLTLSLTSAECSQMAALSEDEIVCGVEGAQKRHKDVLN